MHWRALATLALIGWGAAAFGAAYPWAYIPLFATAALLGASGFIVRGRPGRIDRPTMVALAILGGMIALQLLPLSDAAIARISPETDVLLRRDAIGYGSDGRRHPLSIRPQATTLALCAFASLSVFLLGSARSLTSRDTRAVAGGVSALGIALAVAGIVQNAMWNGKLYGFWVPEQVGSAFGSFNNHNHFAGWMLMAVPLSIGLLMGRTIERVARLKPGWRNRMLWLSSSDANKTVLLGFAILVMAVALVLTMSRSGMFGFLLAMAASGWFVVRRQSTGSRRIVAAGYLSLVVVVAIGWTGFESVASRLSPASVSSMGGRAGVWADAWDIAKRFPLTGVGINSYGAATLYYQTIELDLHYSTAHNDYLQLLAEGGLLVCAPAALAALAFAWAVRRRLREGSDDEADYWVRFGAITGILAMALQEAAEFSLQMPGNAVMFALLCAIALRPPGRSRRRPERVAQDT